MFTKPLTFFFTVLLAGTCHLADAQIQGPTSCTVYTTYTYSYSSSTYLPGPTWNPSGGNVLSSWEDGGGSGTTYYANIEWTSTGTTSLTFSNYSELIATLSPIYVCTSGQSAGVNMTGPTSICLGSSVQYTATPTNGGTSPSYAWKINGVTKQSGSSATYSTTELLLNDVVSVTLTSSILCLSSRTATASKTITSATSPTAVSVSINDPGTLCEGTPITFTATPTNGGSNPTFEWYRNGSLAQGNQYSSSGNQYSPVLPTYAFQNGETMQVKITSNTTCYTGSLTQWSNIVTISYQSPTTPSVSINGSNIFCEGTGQTYTTTSPQTITGYSWTYSGGLPSGNASYALSAGDLQSPGGTVEVTVNVSGTCLSSSQASATLPLTIYEPPQVGTLNINNGSFCSTGTVTLTLTSHLGNNSWQYRYKDGVSGSLSSFSEFSTSSLNSVDFASLASGSGIERYYEFRTQVSNGSCPSATSNTKTVTVYPPPSIGTLTATNGPDFCGSGTLNLNLNAYSGTLDWQYRIPADTTAWTSFSTNSSTSSSYLMSNNGSESRNYEFKVIADNGSCPSVESIIVSGKSHPIPGLPSSSGDMRTEEGIVNLNSTLGTNATTTNWYDAASEGTLLETSQTFSPYVYLSTPYWISGYNSITTCESPRTSLPVYAYVNPADPIISPASAELNMGPVTLSVTNGPYSTYTWTIDGDTVGTRPSVEATIPGTYRLEVRKTGMYLSASAFVPVERAIDDQSPKHYVLVNRIKTENLTDAIAIEGVPVEHRSRTITYLGGLGNTLQTIASELSPLKKDVVQTPKYDVLGRQLNQYLPYISSTNDSKFRNLALDNLGYTNSEQFVFYQQTGMKIATDSVPYSITEVEPSPLQRVMARTGPGKEWHSGGRKVTNGYLLNRETDNIRLWKVISGLPVSNAPYTDYQLFVSVTTDENGNKVKSYADKLGRVVQKDVQSEASTWLKTCYVYDDFGRLAFVLSPEGVNTLSGYSPTQAFLDSWAFQYKYDHFGRAVETKPPAAGWQYTVYDELDRVAMTQSADQRTRNEWTFIKYDVYGRKVVAGYKVIPGSRTTIQADVDAQSYNYEIISADATGYTLNRTYPSALPTDLLSVSYYDNYDFLSYSGWDAEAHPFSFISELGNTETASILTGLPTGQKVRVVNSASPSSQWLNGVQYYDTQSRPVQAISENHLGGLDRTTLKYSFRTQVSETLQTHDGYEAITVRKKMIYDHGGRITEVYQNINNASSDQLVALYVYNELGQLIEKKLHKTGQSDGRVQADPLVGHPGVAYGQNIVSSAYTSSEHTYIAANSIILSPGFHAAAGNTFSGRIGYSSQDAAAYNSTIQEDFLQAVDYRYNIRGWLTSINNAQLNSDGGITNDDTNDYFGMEMLYNTAESGLGNTSLYNGSISAAKWKGVGAVTGNNDRQSYKFTYDKTDRLLTATSQMYNTSSWTKESNVKNENMTYDDNGNVKTLQRNQPKHQLIGIDASYISEPIDDLTFTYKSSNGNQLDKVEDATGKAEGFSNGSSDTHEFTYNADGSISADNNKGIDTIYYNMLGKPWQVVFTDGRKLEYTYSASGHKLKMKFYQGAVVEDSIDYSGGFVYKKGTLEFFASPEGRVVKNGSNFEYQYAITDHQGNTRVLFTSATPPLQSAGTDFESDPGDIANFPTGGNLSSLALFNNTPAGTKSQLLNGGYNGQVGVGKSFAVFPGDTVRIRAYVKYEGTNSSMPGAFATALLAAFNLPTPSPGETGTASAALNTWGSLVDGGFQEDEYAAAPSAHVNIIIFDKDYNFVDAAYKQVSTAGEQIGATPDVDHEHLIREYIIKEQGIVFMYVSNNSPVNVYFDDVIMNHSATKVIQYNEYYPFGLQTANSWTRENASNQYLYNGGNELNENSGWYETFFREYDAAIGRFMQVDPLASSFGSHSPYHYAYNNPMLYNDVLGDSSLGPGSGNHWSDGYRSVSGNYMMMSTSDFRSHYGLDNGFGGTNYERAGELAQALGGSVTDQSQIAAIAAGGFNLSSNLDYFEVPRYEVLYEEGNEVKLRALASLWIPIGKAHQGGMTDFTNSNWALAIGGGVFGAMEGLTGGHGYWLGENQKYYRIGWGGNQHTGARAAALSRAALYRTAGRATVFISAGLGVYSTIEGYQMDGGQFGYNSQKAAVSSAGSILGGLAGAKAGVALGTAVGVWFGGVGAIPGAVIGGVIGGFVGGIGGGYLGGKAGEASVDYYYGN